MRLAKDKDNEEGDPGEMKGKGEMLKHTLMRERRGTRWKIEHCNALERSDRNSA